MPSVKIPRKSTDTDMTPFVDIAFLILSFFIMATKFKQQDAAEVKTPGSVLTKKLPENNALLITIDSSNRVFFSVYEEKKKKGEDENASNKHDEIIQEINTSRKLGLSKEEMAAFRKVFGVGVPFGALKQYLAMTPAEQAAQKLPGIPVLDSLNNQLYDWIRATKIAYAGTKDFQYLIKGDQGSLYPTFEAVINALKKNDVLKYNLITSLEGTPSGSEYENVKKTFKVEPKPGEGEKTDK